MFRRKLFLTYLLDYTLVRYYPNILTLGTFKASFLNKAFLRVVSLCAFFLSFIKSLPEASAYCLLSFVGFFEINAVRVLYDNSMDRIFSLQLLTSGLG